MPSIDLNGQAVDYSVRSSGRAKRIFLNLSPGKGLELVYPVGLDAPAPEALLRQKRDWILAALERLNKNAKNMPAREYKDGEEFLLRGLPYRLKLLKSPSQHSIEVTPAGATLEVRHPPSAGRAHIRAAIEGFYRRLAKSCLPRRLDELAATHGFEYETVRVKNQKTRWGSCSAKRNINLNLRLMMAPDEAIDYVIIHELCHLRELNHNPAFWALVETCCPDYRHWRAWFKQHGSSLIF